MPRVSQVPVDRDVYKNITDSFANLVSDLGKKEEAKIFLSDFLTKEEKLMLSKRLVLALMIKQGYSSNEIKEVLKVSRTTITLMKHWLFYKKGINVGINKLISIEKRNKSEDKIEGILKHLPPLTRSKKDTARWLNR